MRRVGSGEIMDYSSQDALRGTAGQSSGGRLRRLSLTAPGGNVDSLGHGCTRSEAVICGAGSEGDPAQPGCMKCSPPPPTHSVTSGFCPSGLKQQACWTYLRVPDRHISFPRGTLASN